MPVVEEKVMPLTPNNSRLVQLLNAPNWYRH